MIPAASLLGKWRDAASDPKRKEEAAKLAEQVQTLLSGKRPAQEKSPDRVLYDNLVSVESALFAGVDVAKLGKRAAAPRSGFRRTSSPTRTSSRRRTLSSEVRLPAALFAGREFVVEAKLGGPAGERLVRVGVATTKPAAEGRSDGPLLGSATGVAYKQLVAGNDEFRQVFPLFVCFPQVVPTDEVVSPEDVPPRGRTARAPVPRRPNRRGGSTGCGRSSGSSVAKPVAEYEYLPQFMGFTTQDTPKEFQQFFIDRKPLFKKRADDFLKDEEAAIPKQLDALASFAAKAYRRPLAEKEKAELLALYKAVRAKGAAHDEAFRGVLSRVLVAPGVPVPHRSRPRRGKNPVR